MTPSLFVSQLLSDFLSLPFVAPHRISRSERELARQLEAQQVPLHLVRATFLLAAYRRSTAVHPPVRSLHYFKPLLAELTDTPPDPAFLRFIHLKMAATVHFSEIPDDR